MTKLAAALISGAIAITLNMAALTAADLVHVPTAHGGLLRLLLEMCGKQTTLPVSNEVQLVFHFVVGLLMAVMYALIVEPIVPGPAWLRGLTYAILVWLANACFVLPETGEGFAGSRHLTLTGMLWFAAAHTLFFVVQATAYSRLRQARDPVVA
jgi:hypothetical protein